MLTPVSEKPFAEPRICGTSALRAEAMVGAAARTAWMVMLLSLSVNDTPAGETVRAQPSGAFTSYWPEAGR